MQYTLKSLMQAVGCPKWPARWQDIFDGAMQTYDREGCYLADPEFYARQQEQYDCYPVYLEEYMQAAAQVATDEPLARFLTLLGLAVLDREHIVEDCKEFTLPTPPQGKAPLGYDMVSGLALAAGIPDAARRMQRRGLPQEYITTQLQSPCKSVDGFKKRHGGRPGFDLFSWSQRYLDGKLCYFDGLGMEIGCGRGGQGRVYENAAGEHAVLTDGMKIHRSGYAFGSAGCTDEDGAWEAVITETDEAYIGYPTLPDGRTDTTPVTLLKNEWKEIIGPDTPTIGLHISAGTDFSPAAVEEKLEKMHQFLLQYYPEIKTRIFTCVSWLLDPQMQSFLKETSNIVKFQKRFRVLPRVCSGKGVFFFIYNIPNEVEPDLDALSTESSLQAGVVAHYKAGKYIYELPGYFIYQPK